MNKQEVLQTMEKHRLVAVVRLDDPSQLNPVVDALLEGGIRLIEATMTIPDLTGHVPELVKRVGDRMVFGIGSVLNADMARRAIDAGATYLVSPVMKREIIEEGQQAGCLVSVGAYSPTEIQSAWEAGSDVVKVFPADTLGPSYIRGVLAPMPHLRLFPTGGIMVDNVDRWLGAGSFGLGVGSALVDLKAIRKGRFDVIRSNAEAFTARIAEFMKIQK